MHLKRYDLDFHGLHGEDAFVGEDAEGAYVKFEDVERLLDAAKPSRVIKVPEGQTPLNGDLGRPLLGVFAEGVLARKNGTGSPYHGHSLEHCLHAAGWVQQDLRMALDAAIAKAEKQ